MTPSLTFKGTEYSVTKELILIDFQYLSSENNKFQNNWGIGNRVISRRMTL